MRIRYIAAPLSEKNERKKTKHFFFANFELRGSGVRKSSQKMKFRFNRSCSRNSPIQARTSSFSFFARTFGLFELHVKRAEPVSRYRHLLKYQSVSLFDTQLCSLINAISTERLTPSCCQNDAASSVLRASALSRSHFSQSRFAVPPHDISSKLKCSHETSRECRV